MSRMRDIVENWGTFTKDTSSHKTEVTALVPLWPSRAQRGQVAEVHRIRRVVANQLGAIIFAAPGAQSWHTTP